MEIANEITAELKDISQLCAEFNSLISHKTLSDAIEEFFKEQKLEQKKQLAKKC